MTRQKKEIMRKMDEIIEFIQADQELGCGFAPADAYRECESALWDLGEELAHLSHYDSYMEYLQNDRYVQAQLDELPFH